MRKALTMQSLLTWPEELVEVAEELPALSFPSAEGNPGQVVFSFTEVPYSTHYQGMNYHYNKKAFLLVKLAL